MDEQSDEAASLKRYDSNDTNSVRESPLELQQLEARPTQQPLKSLAKACKKFDVQEKT